jgi:7,8-dihydropterin-6-yl-methyl-4-(beta-D-ribofuranosyl)aminobenzene 5'-phosphate synthase
MRTSLGLAVLLFMLSLSTSTATLPRFEKTESSDSSIHITIIYDNYQNDTHLETDWGFACLVEYGEYKLLFDAGRKADLFKQNVTKLEIQPEEIPTLFISHAHWDHTAGVAWITEVNPSVKCYLPSPYADQLKAKDDLPQHFIVLTGPAHMYGPFYSTGDDFEGFKEQGLVIRTDHGGVLITGCGHPGVVDMVEVAHEKLGINVHTVIGGLHLLQTSKEKVNSIAETLQKMGIEQICPTHCTGDQSIVQLKASFGNGYISGGTGKEIIIE